MGIVSLAAILIAGCGGGGGGSAVEGNTSSGPIVTSFAATPTSLDFPGGTVTLSAHVSDFDGVDAVNATVYSSASQSNINVTMTNTSGDYYTGSFTSPSNTNSYGIVVSYSVRLSARDMKGNSTITEPVLVEVVPPDPPIDQP